MAINARQQLALNRFSLSRPELSQKTNGDARGELLFGEDIKLGDIVTALESADAGTAIGIESLQTAVTALQFGYTLSLSEVNRDAIEEPAEGMVVYNLTSHKLNIFTGEDWEEITSAVPA